MIRINLLLLLVVLNFINGNSQEIAYKDRKVIDTSAIRLAKQWPDIQQCGISENGRYTWYCIANKPTGKYTLVVQTMDGQYRRELVLNEQLKLVRIEDDDWLADNDNWFVFNVGNKVLLFDLGSQVEYTIDNANALFVFSKQQKPCMVLESVEAGEQKLIMYDLHDKNKVTIPVSSFWLMEKMGLLLYQAINSDRMETLNLLSIKSDWQNRTELWKGASSPQVLMSASKQMVIFRELDKSDTSRIHVIDLSNRSQKVIWEGKINPPQIRFDSKEKQIVFNVNDTLWRYSAQRREAVVELTPKQAGLCDSCHFAEVQFNPTGQYITAYIVYPPKELTIPLINDNLKTAVDVWSYKDKDLPPEQRKSDQSQKYWELISHKLGSSGIVKITDSREIIPFIKFAGVNVLLQANAGLWYDKTLDTVLKPETVVSLENGKRKLVWMDLRSEQPAYTFSPDGKFLVYYDCRHKSYFSYEIETGITRDLVKDLKVNWGGYVSAKIQRGSPIFGADPCPRGIAGWTDSSLNVLIYDYYDIWKVNLTNAVKPVNITNGFGVGEKTIFTLDEPGKLPIINVSSVSLADISGRLYNNRLIYLKAKNERTCETGLYKQVVGSPSDPVKIEMGFHDRNEYIKTKKTDTWIVKGYTANNYQRLSVLSPGKPESFIARLNPQKEYRWYKTEVFNFRLKNGRTIQGVLNKPDDPDSTKKYPLIFCYYENHGGVSYGSPGLSNASGTNVPYYTSRGYIVVSLDIFYEIGHPMESAFQCIESAAKYLSKRKDVDPRHMGISGHSWGGVETNYVAMHSKLFACAVAGAGLSDFVSGYNSLLGMSKDGTGTSAMHMLFEFQQARMPFTLWQYPSLYIANSAIFAADRCITPLLMLHNKLDAAAPWLQSVELFNSLRRLKKPCWMLQYDGEPHQLDKEQNILDYSIRQEQFFNHYLKEEPAPKWMTYGVPADLKGIASGYELDPNGRCNENCKVCKKWNILSEKGNAK